MNTVSKAAQVIADHNADGVCDEPLCVAADLDTAGCLAPNLPAPHEHGGKLVWYVTGEDGDEDEPEWTVSLHDGWIRLADEHGAVFPVELDVARGLGLALVAATNTAQG